MPIRLLTSVAATALLLTLASSSAQADSSRHCGTSHVMDTGRIGIGGAVGHEWQIDERDGDQLSLLGQFRLTPRTTIELESGRTEYHDSNEVDKRFGGALALQVGRLAFLSPYIVGGVGVAGNSDQRNTYLEAGGGVKFPISRNFVLMLDVRSGRHFAGGEADSDGELITRASSGGSTGTADLRSTDIDYSRWRLVGMVFF